MADKVTKVPLTPVEVQLLAECKTAGRCASLTTQITRHEREIERLKKLRSDGDKDHRATLVKILSNKSPAVPVADGAKLTHDATDIIITEA